MSGIFRGGATVIATSAVFVVSAVPAGAIMFFRATVGQARLTDTVVIAIPPAQFGSYVISSAQVVDVGVVGFGLLATDDIDPFTATLPVVLIRP